MKKYILAIIICLPSIVISKNYTSLDSLFLGTSLWPEDISYNASLLLPKYFNGNKSDSIDTIIKYWEEYVGDIEPLIRFKILYQIYNDNFSEDIYNKYIPELLLYYRDMKDIEYYKKDWEVTFYSFGYGMRKKKFISNVYNNFTAHLANELFLKKVKEGTPEYLLCKFYSYNFQEFFKDIRSDRYQHTKLKKYCDEYVDGVAKSFQSNLALFTGYWLPQGKNKILGNHPQLGFTAGFKFQKLLFDFTMAVRFLDSKEPYMFEYQGNLKSTNKFQASYMGVELGYELFRSNHFEFDILGGLAWDALIPVSEDKNQPVKRIEAFNSNVALGIRYYFNQYSSKYLGFQLRNNFVHYKTEIGSDLSGDVVSLRLIFGFANDKHKQEIRKAFGHKF